MAELTQVLRQLPKSPDPKLLVGLDTADDAGVYALDEKTALVQTVDFFPPIVDDPFDFGRISAANALSDIYAMGGTPLTALNMVCFPVGKIPFTVLTEILRGSLEKLGEAGVALLGGHTVDDNELKFGLAITGTISRERIVTNSAALPGDMLVLTKPLGIGILSTALKAEMISEEALAAATSVMLSLNRVSSRAMLQVGVNACTDITGFGLLGHAHEMAEASGVSFEIQARDVPVIPETRGYASQGLVPGGAHTNRNYLDDFVQYASGIGDDDRLILCDPQTSGGLLLSVPSERASLLLERLMELGVNGVTIGRVLEGSPGRISVT
jgi:selenide,water dikinase